MNEISKMTYEEMLHYTTKNNKDAIITVGVIEKDKITYKVYGEDGILLTNKEHTYEIGSITKTFTTSLLCKAITEDRVSLDDTIDMYLNLPDKESYPTIKRLVTHTSGYKSHYFEKPMISNFFQRKNDFYGITEKMLLKRLGKMNLKDTDYSFQYSNFGFATLGAMKR
jgi:CubicO group peptidase (beta-lactamase class C family)